MGWVASECVGNLLECALGSYSSHSLHECDLMSLIRMLLGECLPILTCGLMVVLFLIKFLVPRLLGPVLMLMCLVMLEGIVSGRHLDTVQFCSVPGPLQTAQRAELWVIRALQALGAVDVGVDDLDVVRHVGRLVDGVELSRPFDEENDGDFLALVREMTNRWSESTARVTKVKGR